MAAMFVRCISLTSLDISEFDTSQVTNFFHMFEDCSLITSLDLSKFNTSSIENMRAMFIENRNLKSLDLSNFNFSKISDIAYMFAGCSNLKYINLKSLIINDNIEYTLLINNHLINQIICIDDKESLNKIISLYKCNYLNDSENWGEYKDKIINNDNIIINDCLLSKYDINCYEVCLFYYYYDENKNKYLCTENLKCPEPYNKLIYGKNECIKSCSETKEYKYELALNNICLAKCSDNFYKANDKLFTCLPKCPIEKPFLYVESLECVSHCTIKERQNKLCTTYYTFTKDINNNIFDKVISQTRNELTNNFDNSVVNGNIINENGANITITRSKNENFDDNELYLGECEERLKHYYNISQNETLYIFRIDIEQIGMQIPSLEYEILYPINGNKNLVKLNLSICHDLKIDRVITVDLIGNLDKYNKNSPYYNDICYIVDSDYGTDISLSDRREDYINKNMGVCEEGCELSSYNYETKKAVCSCNIKTEIPLINNIKLDKDTLLNSFIEINNIANIQILKCYKIVFQKNNILKNIGFFIYLCLIIFNLISFLHFVIKDYKKLTYKIYNLKANLLNDKKANKIISYNIYKKNKKANFHDEINNIKSSERKLEINYIYKEKKISVKKKLNKIHSPPKNKFNNISKNKRKSINNKKNKIKIDINKNLINKKINIKKGKNIELNFNEINHLTFDDALIKDSRTFFQYYSSLLKTNHLFLFIFYSKDYNSKAIKVSIFIFNLSSGIAINSLFFNDSTMHKIYTDHGSFDFLYQLPQIIYSTIISDILDFLINILGLSEQNVLKIKNCDKSSNDVYRKINSLLRILKIKFTFFFIINFVVLFLFWYYVSCFCGIYRNTQIHLLKDSLFSFITSLITPFILYLFPGLFRICALKRRNKTLYRFSRFLQTI